MKKSNCPVGDDEDKGETCKELPQQQEPRLKLLQGLLGKPTLLLLQVVVQLSDQRLAEGVEEDLQEGVEHAEDHPDVDHLGIRRRRQRARETNKTVEESVRNNVFSKLYLQGCKNEEDGEVDLDDDVQVVFGEGVGKVGDEDEDGRRQEGGEDAAGERPRQLEHNFKTRVLALEFELEHKCDL